MVQQKKFNCKLRKSLLTLVLSTGLSAAFAQVPSDFSGSWLIDNSKSDAAYKDYKITLTINQTQQSIKIEEVLTMKDGSKSSMDPLTYTLDGKETKKEEQGGIDKQSSSWSSDRKTLTLKYVRTVNGSDFGSNTSYTLTPDGRTMTVKTTDLKGGSATTMVYNKQ
ncbi:MAG TPA: hypothetical protein VHO46_12900 [Bacteroidales bacterium]|nr:hypothetical protein [Bacteroidales bacterium]